MQVKEIMTPEVETIDADIMLVEAASLMRKLDTRVMPVRQEQQLVGIITDRDITIRAAAEGKAPKETTVREVMTPQIFYCFEEDDINKAASIMKDKGLHKLLVINKDNQPVGFISYADFTVTIRDGKLGCEILEKKPEPACPNR
jgi:CBS domain-containing protein